MPDQDSVLRGTAVRNSDVAAFIRKHGPASFSKPNGPNQTILYYPAPPQERAEAEEFEDFAGKQTPGERRTVIQGGAGGSQVVSTKKVAGGRVAQVDAKHRNLNEEAKKAEIGEIDPEEATAAERDEDAPEPTRDQEPADAEIEQQEPEEVDPTEEPQAVESEVVEADESKLDGMTKAELLEVARDTELEGRSDMTKAELLEALKEEKGK